MKVLVINGPNINLLGLREPAIYGPRTYDDLLALLRARADALHVTLTFFQSNHEGAIVDAIQQAYADHIDGILINPAAYTHTSIAIPDALAAVRIPAVEVHISDPDTREPFRHVSHVRPLCIATVAGRGLEGYLDALDILLAHLAKNPATP